MSLVVVIELRRLPNFTSFLIFPTGIENREDTRRR